MAFNLKAVAVVVGSSFLLASAYGQTSKGTLAGIARDTTGASLPKATITLKGESTGESRTTTANDHGEYRFDALSPERYTVTGSEPGFATFKAQHVNVQPSIVTTYNLQLSVGSQTSEITVDAAQVGVNTESSQQAGTISGAEIATLPTTSLSPFEQAVTIPGVQTVQAENQLENGQVSQVNGARPRSNNFLLDSQEINDIGIGGQAFQPQILDMYEDLTVITSTASAEYGRAGGGIFNLVTKSGSNTFHGTVYDRYGGSGLNSKDFGIRGTTTDKGRYDTHTMGFTAGGPIFKDKLFAFGGAQWYRYYGVETIAPVLLPDAAGLATLGSLVNTTYPGATAQAANLLAYLRNGFYLTQYKLVPSLPGQTINLDSSLCAPGAACTVSESYFQRPFPSEQSPDTQWSVRVDYKPSMRDTFYYRYLHDRSSLTPDFFANAAGGTLGLDTYQGGPSELGAGSWTHVFNQNIVNELRGSETRINFLFGVPASTLAIPAYNLPTLGLSGFPSLGPDQNFPQGRAQDLYQIQDTFSWTHGRNTIRAGFDIGRLLEKDTLPQNVKGSISIAGTVQTALNNYLYDQLGDSGSVSLGVGPLRADPHSWRSGGFIQDDIKLTPELVLNLGVRYDYTTNPENSLQYPGIDVNNPFQAINTVIKVNNDYNNVSPRIGFAYAPSWGGYFGSGKTSIRGGFGIFYDSYFSNFVTNAAATAPNSYSSTLTQTTATGPLAPEATLAGLTPTLSATSTVESVDKNMRQPQTYQYNLGIEQEVTKGVILGIRYIGNHGSHLFANQQFNYVNGTTGLRLNTARGIIIARGNYADSNYNGLQLDTTIRLGRTLDIRSNYVFSKALDNASEIFTIGDNPTTYGVDLGPNGRRREYGNSAYDHRQFFSVAYSWRPNGFHAEGALSNLALGLLTRNWTIAGVSQLQSGPYGAINSYGLDQNGDGSAANDRPIIGNISAPFESAGVDGALVGGTQGTYYDVATLNSTGGAKIVTANDVHFLVPYNPTNSLLNSLVHRNTFLNPGSTTHNFAIQKGFSPEIKHFERGQFLLRAELNNVFNHNDRGYQDTDVLDFGLPTSLNTDNLARRDTQRTMILWAKFVF